MLLSCGFSFSISVFSQKQYKNACLGRLEALNFPLSVKVRVNGVCVSGDRLMQYTHYTPGTKDKKMKDQ